MYIVVANLFEFDINVFCGLNAKITFNWSNCTFWPLNGYEAPPIK